MIKERLYHHTTVPVVITLCAVCISSVAFADGIVRAARGQRAHRSYHVYEKHQEAILVSTQDDNNKAIQEMILKITVAGKSKDFGWIIPFPSKPDIQKESPGLFKDLSGYLNARMGPKKKRKSAVASRSSSRSSGAPVRIIENKVVGNFETTVLTETAHGGLNQWLGDNGFEPFEEESNDVIGWYRKKGYVFACIRVKSELRGNRSIQSHPLRFTFRTGGTDGIFFPMKLTGEQDERFSVRLWVFRDSWLNESINRFGHDTFRLKTTYHDFDTAECVPNEGKSYASPQADPFLRPLASKLSIVSQFFESNYPNDKFYLSVLDGHYSPDDLQSWPGDIWLFPHYVDDTMSPFDVHENGPAAGGWWGTIRPPTTPPETASPIADAPQMAQPKMTASPDVTGAMQSDSSILSNLLPLWLALFFGGIVTFVWVIWNSRRKGRSF